MDVVRIAGCRAFALLIDFTDHYSIAMCTVSFICFSTLFLYVYACNSVAALVA